MSTRSICIRWASSGSRHGAVALLLALLTACATSTEPTAPVTVGSVDAVSGAPALVRKSRQYLIGAQSRIYAGDALETDRFSVAHITLVDGSSLIVGRDSRIVFNHFELPEAHLTLTGGTVRIAPAASPDRATRLSLQTPVATIRARGSELLGAFVSADNTLDVSLLGGDPLQVTNLHGTVDISSPGDGTTVIGGTAPQISRQWTPGKIERTLGEMELAP